MKTTLAAVLVKQNTPLQLMDLQIPPLLPGQVLIQIAYSGICRSQINEWKGNKGIDRFLPHTLGHEAAGVVVECGEGVTKVQVGDHVIASWIKSSGKDCPSTKYQNSQLVINSGAISTFMRYAIISENRLIPIPKTVPLDIAALFGCAIPTGAGIIYNEITETSLESASVAILGIGGIGSSALLAAAERKMGLIIAIDISEEKLAFAKKLGATHALNANNSEMSSELARITGGGVDYAIECAGNKYAMEKAFTSVKDNGGLCIIAGNIPKGEKISIDPFDLIKGKKIKGSWGGSSNPDKDIPKFLSQFANNPTISNFIGKIVPLSQINEAFEKIGSFPCSRILLDCSK